MAENQAWVTYASNDHDALKSVVLGRSLRESITRRKLIIFVAAKLSDEIVKLVQDEFDSCIRVTDGEWEGEFPNQPFSLVAKAYCWRLKRIRKFVFLDCDCLVLRNSDELFNKTGLELVETENGKTISSVIAGKPNAGNGTPSAKKVLQDLELMKRVQKLRSLGKEYCIQVDLEKDYPLTGQEMKIVHFVATHPLDLIVEHKEHLIKEMGQFQQCLVKLFLEMIRVEKMSCKIQNNGTTFVAKVKYAKSLLKNATNTIIRNPEPHILEDLKDSIAIVGMSFRFPGANTIDEFWDLLINGRDGIIRVPEWRWNKDQCFIRGDNTKDTQAGFLKCPIDMIDGKFFGINAAELAYMDPQQRLCLQVVWEGLENAGICASGLKDTLTGVFGGWWRNDYKEMLQEAGLNETEFFRAYMGNALGTVTGRISHFLELTGPSISTESGCSTSIVAVDMACNSLREENCNVALAVGVNLLLHPFSIDAMNAVVAMDGHCKTFDAKADGFGRAEGCAVLVLKRFADAATDGDRIWGVIRGSAVVQEGPSKSLGTPTVQCEALAMELALERAGVEPSEVSFVETHGTGTPVGDPLEVAAVAKVYSEGRTDVLTIGSVKTNIGHTESVSGIAGIVKTVLSLQNEMIPPHLHLEKLNPEINLDVIPAQIPTSPLKWDKVNGKPRIAGVSSFGITGTDAHVILQESPEIFSKYLGIFENRPRKMLTISAKSMEGLNDYLHTYETYLKNTEDKLKDIEFSTNVGRSHFPYRVAIFGENKEKIIQKLENKSYETKHAQSDSPKLCFLFTGQGSQYPGMSKALYNNSLVFKSHFDNCEKILNTEYGFSIRNVLWDSSDAHALSRTLYSQTSIFIVEYCLLKLWESFGVKAHCVLGHSLGEFAAAVAAGILTFKDALKLVVTRSKLIDSLPQGKMLVIKENLENVQKLLKMAFAGTDNWLDIAAVNTSEQTVLAGDSENIENFANLCNNNKIKTIILASTHAFHSRHMNPVLNDYKKTADKIIYNTQTCEFISGMEGQMMKPGEINADYWVDHTREKVSFVDASKVALEAGCTHFLEIGPQPVLSAMILINSDLTDITCPPLCLPSIRKTENEWETMMSSFSKLYVNGIPINWENYHRYSNAKKVDLPSYPFQPKSHWMELKTDEAIPIHPLVGTPVPNPSTLKIFRSNIDVNRIKFLKDHVLGNKIIFPGAGFLEMCLVSGHSAVQCTEGNYCPPTSALTIDNFQIEAPLCLAEDGKTQLQVTVSHEDNGETRATIYSKLTLDKETHKWIKHASGVFSPFASKWEGEEGFYRDTLENIKARCSEKVTSQFSYTKLEEYGMKFGPTFQTVERYWKGNDESYFEIKVTDNPKRYILHPVITDAMFQALMATSNPDAKKLHVPITIQKFIAVAKLTTENCYVYCKTMNAGSKEYTALLSDGAGALLAVMVGAEFMETTVSNVVSLIEAQRTPYPNMYEDVWREQLGPFERRSPKEEFELVRQYNNSVITKAEAEGNYNRLPETQQYFLDQSNLLNSFYMIKAFQDLNFNGEIGDKFTLNQLISLYSIQPTLNKMLRYMIVELAKDGYFKILQDQVEDIEAQIVSKFPPKDLVVHEIDSLFNTLKHINAIELNCVASTGKCLADLLTGRQSALSILFPEENGHGNGQRQGPAELYYYASGLYNGIKEIANHVAGKVFKFIGENRKNAKTVLRILEIGAGTGSFTETILPHMLADGPSHYEYTYTDISPAFFPNGERVFENSKMRVNYKVLNIEEDPTSQGFIPHHYDIIMSSFCIHATKDIKQSMANVRNLLKEDGLIVLTELVKPHRSTNIVFGVLEGFWRFTDTDLRPHNCEMDTKSWENVLNELDFKNISVGNAYNSHCAIISADAKAKAGKSEFYSKHLTSIKKTWVIFSDGSSISDFYANKLLSMRKNVIVAKPPGINSSLVGTQNYEVRHENPADIEKLFESVSKEQKLEGVIYLWGLSYTRTNYEEVCQPFLYLSKILVSKEDVKLLVFTQHGIHVEDSKLNSPMSSPVLAMAKVLQNENQTLMVKCVDLDDLSAENFLEEGFSELFVHDHEINVVYRGHRRLVPRLVPWKISNTSLKFPKSGPYKLILPPSHEVSDLRFGSMELPALNPNQVQIKVKAFGLNFRDLFTIMKPDPVFESFNTVGIDYSGIVTAVGQQVTNFKVGDAAFGINLHGGAMPSHVQMDEDMVIPLPNEMTFCDGATLPAVAATAYVCLIELAHLKSEDTVLIHVASGGVGLCAVQIAQSLGCTIVATAGSNRKRTFLKHLGIQHVFHSRNTNYEKDVRKALNGKGVDVVLNSLTGEGFKEASLALCNTNARFIEMSKMNIWSKEDVQARRPDVRYETIDLSLSTEESMKENMKQIKSYLKESTLKPIPYVRFDAAEVRQALTYLQDAKHIGKVVCVMPEDGVGAGSSAVQTPLFNARSTYLITGGLGGIGLEVAKWMAVSGAKNIVLVGRNPPREKTAQEIQKLILKDFNVRVMQCDVGNKQQCALLLNEIKETGLPPLRGIMHAAGVLSDGLYYNQTWEKFEKSFNPKVRGGWNLHELTLNYSLEHFIMFSSVTTSVGSIGQGNHCAANQFLDSLAHYRNSIGLPAISINWGQWGQVGVAADMEVIGIRPFTVLQGVSALEKIMKSHRQQTTVLEAEFHILRKGLFTTKKYLEELKTTNTENHLPAGMDADKFWKEYDDTKTREEKYAVVRKYVSDLIRIKMKMEVDEVVDDDANFQDMGMDSLMMIEMKNGLQLSVGKRVKLTVNSVRDCKTVAQLSNRLVELISGVEELPLPSKEELIELIKEDSKIPEDIKVDQKCSMKVSEIRTVLITGVTGNFGPYVLREICRRPEIEKIYCLMRDNRLFSPKERLKQMLADKKLLSEIDMNKIECIAGDITLPKMGMTDEIYKDLAEKVDGIFHLSVKASIDEYYCKSEHVNHSRTVNVKGTKNVLKFACDKRTKHVFHASTTISTTKPDKDGVFAESWPVEGEFDDQPNSAYSVSKFICDRLVASAVERGIPCKAFRFPFMGGDSKLGGNVSVLDNHLMMRMMVYMQVGMMPARNMPVMIVPVDIAADLSLKIFFNDETPYEMYNVSNPYVEDEILLEDVSQEFGTPVKVVETDEFFRRMETLEGEHAAEIKGMARKSRPEDLNTLEENPPPAYSAWLAGKKDIFLSKKLSKWLPQYPKCMKPAWEILKNDLKFAKESGIFSKVSLH